MTDFASLNLAEPIARALASEGYTTPTPIQAQAIPPALERRDILGIAQTGTGKTAAFALPILQHLANNPKPLQRKATRVLVLAPTRELAGQIADSFRAYGQNLTLTVETVFGGVPVPRHVRRMERGTDILVATPGRLIDLIEQKALFLCHVEVLVLDEADQMLDLGFIHALRRIVPLLPKGRQTLFFSATMPKAIAELADSYLKDPVRVAVTPVATTAERVEQRVMFASAQQKTALLVHTLRDAAIDRALVFTRTKHGADRVVRNLARAGIRANAIHGNKSQPQRQKALDAFRSGDCPVLIATDIAARGIDVDGVSHVVNYEVPNVPEQYVHRIGRTARAGRDGIAVSFVAGDERAYLKDIERLTRQRIAIDPLPEGMDALLAELAVPAAGEDEEVRFEPAGERHGGGGGRDRQRHRNGGQAGGGGRHGGRAQGSRGGPSPRAERSEAAGESGAKRQGQPRQRDGEGGGHATESDFAGLARAMNGGSGGGRGGERGDGGARGQGGPRGNGGGGQRRRRRGGGGGGGAQARAG